MKITLLLSRLPWPPDGGDRIRATQVARALADLADVRIVATCRRHDDVEAARRAFPFARLDAVPLSARALARAAAALPTRGALQAALYDEPAARRAAAESADLVVAHLIRTVPWVPAGAAWIADLQDALSMQYASARPTRDPREFAFHLEARRVAAAEDDALARAGAAAFISERDRAFVIARRTPHGPAIVAPGAIDDADLAPPARVEPSDVLFVGNLRTAPNRAMVRTLTSTVLPRVPGASLAVVGVGPRPRVRPGDRDVGAVPDVRPYYAGASVVACPMDLGSGVQNKVLQAMAQGAATLLTPAAAEALPGAEAAGACVVAPLPHYAEALAALRADPARRARIGALAREWVAAHHHVRVALAPYRALAASMLGPRGATTR